MSDEADPSKSVSEASEASESSESSEASEASESSELAAAAAAPSVEPSKPAAASIPPPKIERAAKRGLDPVAIAAMLAFVIVGGLLVFGFAQALVPAAEAQLGAACRPFAPTPKTGPVPELELEDLAGNPVSLADFRGKFLVVNFWATWCQPCTREWPDLDILADRLSERDDIKVIAISVDQERDELLPYLERMGLLDTRVTIVRAKAADAQKLFGSEKIPDTYFVNRSGEFEALFVNVRAWGKSKGVRCVESSADRG